MLSDEVRMTDDDIEIMTRRLKGHEPAKLSEVSGGFALVWKDGDETLTMNYTFDIASERDLVLECVRVQASKLAKRFTVIDQTVTPNCAIKPLSKAVVDFSIEGDQISDDGFIVKRR